MGRRPVEEGHGPAALLSLLRPLWIHPKRRRVLRMRLSKIAREIHSLCLGKMTTQEGFARFTDSLTAIRNRKVGCKYQILFNILFTFKTAIKMCQMSHIQGVTSDSQKHVRGTTGKPKETHNTTSTEDSQQAGDPKPHG